ncbi:segregation and condensation protein B [Dyella jiangningensis]|uniref:SMC-Scp complex subunit ScpB n=1 Tax=Dyella sp. AtDHG13 TaxID=1938897 RepID=UPI000892455A|nr:SMC-Scp complex subunit ScpB [Dyella sp. AtDHG13]PXV60568.1 condensin subunit ScpB [Dyella sp. AtDHG13]SDJ50630.1 segregation and condensation protein B [Dyella jiangningensis]
MQIEQLKPIIEAALLASTQPMTVPQLLELFGEEDEVGREEIAKTLEALAEDCAHRGVELREVGSGFRYQVKQAVHPWISRMWTEKPSRYSRALLETLALIAYRQPITRPEIEQIRGVVVSSNIIKTMEEREWIRVVGYRDVPGKPALFGTTRAFLDYFNLKSLDELPPLSEIRDMEDPQMSIAPEPLPAHVARDLPIDPDEEDETLVVAGEENDAVVAEPGEAEAPAHSDESHPAAVEEPGHETPEAMEIASPEPDAAAVHVEALTDTADEAATHADAEQGDATQDTEEYRA